MLEYTITLTDAPTPADVDVVRHGLDAYDASQGAVVDWVPLALFARDAEGVIIAGLTGSTYWGYLYIGRLWTEKRFRNFGLGSRLLADAEQEAQRRVCHSVHLMTGDFNALPFSQKRGYTMPSLPSIRSGISPPAIPTWPGTCSRYSSRTASLGSSRQGFTTKLGRIIPVISPIT
jgi:GNAT superfamily N-acetyltransferase